MKFSKMRPQPSKELKIPNLAGGINLRDGLGSVLDNQLIDSSNMWFRDGVLKTRPSFRIYGQAEMKGDAIKRHNCYKTNTSGERMQLCSRMTYSGGIAFAWCGKGNIIELPEIKEIYLDKDSTYFVVKHNEILYCYTSNYKIYKLESDATAWAEIKKTDTDQIYVPLLYAHCKNTVCVGSYDLMGAGTYKIEFKGDMFEGINLLGSHYKMIYSTKSAVLEKSYMIYKFGMPLPDRSQLAQEDGYKIIAKHTANDGAVYTHEIPWYNGGSGWESSAQGDGYTAYIDETRNTIAFWKLDETNQTSELGEATIYIEDNLEIIAPYIPTEEENKKVFLMTETEWFGGNAEGLSGGTRLFLCGNRDSKEKALVCCSGLNNPLYFPESAHYYVGEEGEAATGFGKQSDILVLFKENEIWCSRYNQNTNITASDIINQTVADYTASSVYFTLSLINSTIGCSNADTIQLCRNRLVWLGSDNKVYTLVTDNQYNERTVFCVSEMIDRRIKAKNSREASACDWEGYYCICFRENVFLMDYNCYGYTHITSYSKSEDANLHIPWYCWEIPSLKLGNTVLLSLSNNMLFAQCSGEFFNVLGNDTENVSDESESYNSIPIACSFKTKVFDFGESSVRKNLSKINLQLGNNYGAPIRVELITECGNEEMEITLEGADANDRSAAYIESKALFPCMRQIIKMGLKLSCEGVMAIEGLSFNYRITGGAR